METKHLNERGKMFLKSNHLADCSFYFPNNNIHIKANKTLLALASPIMNTMFFGNSAYVEAETGIVEMHDIDVNVFEKFLLWVYAKELDLKSVDEAIAVYHTANKYEVIDLELICEQYVYTNVTVENVGLIWQFGHLYNKSEVKAKAVMCIQRHTTQVLDSLNFSKSDVNMLCEILEQNELWIEDETMLFVALEKFAKRNSVDRQHLDAALKCIRFKIIDTDILKLKSILLSDEEKMAIVESMKSENAAIGYPEGFSKSTVARCADYVRISECEER